MRANEGEKVNRCSICCDPRVYDSLDWLEGETLHKVHYCREHWQAVIKLFKDKHTEIAAAIPDLQHRTKELYRRLQDGDALEV